MIPGNLVSIIGEQWQKWALWLPDHIELLKQVGKENHVDQVSFSIATHELSIPIKHISRKYNFPVHLPIEKTGYPSMLHYHRMLSKVGLLDINGDCDTEFQRAILEANELIGSCFNNRIFWSFRYNMFPELGSGVGSREQNLAYKRALLQALNIEASPSVLDVGCGDLEVIKTLTFQMYTGINVSSHAIELAQTKRPDLQFMLYAGKNDAEVPVADTVLCLEVLIHQKTVEDYERVIDFLTQKTTRRLIVSGYTNKERHDAKNHMLSYHESLFDSLNRTGKFATIRQVGAHSDVSILMAEVKTSTIETLRKALKRSLNTVRSFLFRSH